MTASKLVVRVACVCSGAVLFGLGCGSGAHEHPGGPAPGLAGTSSGNGGLAGVGGAAGAIGAAAGGGLVGPAQGGAPAGASGTAAGRAGAAGAPASAAGASADGGSGGIGVRFIGFVGDGPTDDLPAARDVTALFPECAVEASTLLPSNPRFNECHARGVVRLMNAALAGLIADAPPFRFDSFETIVEPKLADWDSGDDGSSYQLQRLQGNTYRLPNTMTFVMPAQYHGSFAGLSLDDQRLSPDFGMLSIAVPSTSSLIFVHEFGHDLGFPHAGNAAGVGTFQYDGCGGVSFDPPDCLCESSNYMATQGSFAPVSSCDECDPVTATTWNTPYYGPKFAAIAECWLTRRLEPPSLVFADGDCFGWVESDFASCKELETGSVTCQCPSGQLFAVADCTDATQDARDAAASAACDRITCAPPPERPGVVCEGLAGTTNIQCACEDQTTLFYLGTDCTSLTLDAVEHVCPPPQ